MTTVHSFAPIIDSSARTLILGSMPGAASLAADQYYAHPRNAFWPIMDELFGAGRSVAYEERTGILLRNGIALWDVLKLCTRHGSLDSAIVESSIETNDFDALIMAHPSIDRIFFNGAKAESSFLRYVVPTQTVQHLDLVRLPSTSPAFASMSFDRKLESWRSIQTDRA